MSRAYYFLSNPVVANADESEWMTGDRLDG